MLKADPFALNDIDAHRGTVEEQVNHMVVARTDVDRSLADEAYRMLDRSRQLAGSPAMNPFGIEANRRNLEVAIDCIHAQRMIPRRFTVEELFA